MSFSAASYRVRCDHVDRLRELMRQHVWDGAERNHGHLCREHRKV